MLCRGSHTYTCVALVPATHDLAGDDIIDEALTYFRANVLFKSFEPKGGADMLIIYLTLFIHKVRRAPRISRTHAERHTLHVRTCSSVALDV